MTLYQKLDDWEDRLIEGLIEDVILTADLQDARIIRKLPTRDARFMTSFPLLPPANDEESEWFLDYLESQDKWYDENKDNIRSFIKECYPLPPITPCLSTSTRHF
jgi:hypothetical protein